MTTLKRLVVVSLGGSLIVPHEIDVVFLAKFKRLVEKFKRTHQFILVCGGGATSRAYDFAARSVSRISDADRDLIGVTATWLNAQLVAAIFKTNILHVHDRCSKAPVVVVTDKISGTTSDGVTVAAALHYKSGELVNLTNVEYVYTKDPRTFSDAKPIKSLSWNDYFRIIPDKRVAHMHVPFDPSASRIAARHHLTVASISGHDLKQFENYLRGRSFKGTVIHP